MIDIRKLECGATVIMERSDFVRSAALGIWVGTGSSREWDEVSGVSHFIEHMMFKGTGKRSARQIAEDVDRIGGMCNAFTGKEATCYYIKTLSSNICKGAEIILDMVTGSVFDPEELEKERQVILEEIKMVKDSPDEDVMDTISELVNSGSPIGRTILGTPESLAGLGSEELRSYFRKEYTCDSIVIAAAGNFDPDQITAMFEEGLSGLGRKKEPLLVQDKEYQQKFQVKVKEIEQTHICLACPSVSLGDELYYAFVLMNSIFGGSMSSRLFQNIREEKGLAYSVASMNAFSSRSGFFNIYAGVAHDKVGETIEAIRWEMQKLMKEGVSAEELSMAKEQVKSSYIFGLENINSRMFNLGKNKLLLDRVFQPDDVLRAYDSVTQDDIMEAASRIGDPGMYCGAAVTGQDFDLEEMIKA